MNPAQPHLGSRAQDVVACLDRLGVHAERAAHSQRYPLAVTGQVDAQEHVDVNAGSASSTLGQAGN